jgi:lactoylglutathione lyase
MITQVGKISVYVNSQEDAKKFWVDKIGFHVTIEQQFGPIKWIEVAPPDREITSLILYSKVDMLQHNPSAVCHPTIIMVADHIEDTHSQLLNAGVKVTEVKEFPHGKMFNFYDPDGNEYMVRQ